MVQIQLSLCVIYFHDTVPCARRSVPARGAAPHGGDHGGVPGRAARGGHQRVVRARVSAAQPLLHLLGYVWV